MRSASVCECGDHAWAALNGGHVTLVSPQHVDVLAARTWCVTLSNGNYYVRCAYGKMRNGVRLRRSYHLHREICPASAGQVVDHINGDALDNRDVNLRSVSRALNSHYNMRRRMPGARYRGVTFNNGAWRACIVHEGKQFFLGRFATEADAAIAYDLRASAIYGREALLNFGSEQ